VSVEAPYDPHEHLLGQVLGCRAVPGRSPQKAIDREVMTLEDTGGARGFHGLDDGLLLSANAQGSAGSRKTLASGLGGSRRAPALQRNVSRPSTPRVTGSGTGCDSGNTVAVDPLGKQSRRKLQRRQSDGRSTIAKSSSRAWFRSGSSRSAFMLPALFWMK